MKVLLMLLQKRKNKLRDIAVISFLILFSHSLFAAKTNKFIVLVPGFFNSFSPSVPRQEGDFHFWKNPYFSEDIVESFRGSGYDVGVVHNLSPFGDVKENGSNLIRYLNEVIRKKDQGVEFYLVAHSAGGLYSLYAAANSKLPIKRIISLSTPFGGLKLIDDLEEKSAHIDTFLKWMSLDSVIKLNGQNVAKFIQSLRVPEGIRIDAYAGYQPAGFAPWDAAQLSWLIMIPHGIIQEKSDGIVTVQSALFSIELRTKLGKKISMHQHTETIPLDHWEQVLDYRLFAVLGVINLNYIREQQIKFYTDLAKSLN